MKNLSVYFFLMVFAACQSSVTRDLYTYGEEFDLAIGEEVRVGRENISVEFMDVLEDSRCPSNVMCVWAGNAKVKMRFNQNDIQLNTYLEPHDVAIEDVNIQLLSLEPYPEYPRQFEKEDYRVQLLITKE